MQRKKKRRLNEDMHSLQLLDIGQNKKMHKNMLFKCKEKGCDKSFAKKDHLIKHRSVHFEGSPFECEKCGNSYKLQSNLNHHIKRVHEKVIRFKCDWEGCDKGFYAEFNLKLHLRVHTGERPFECDICLKRFTQKVTRNKHHRRCYNKSCQSRPSFLI